MMANLKGQSYLITKGQLAGKTAKIIGRDGLFPDDDKWIVEVDNVKRWGVEGKLLRERLDVQI